VAREKVSVLTPRESSSHRAVIVLDFANACIRVNGFRGEKRDCGVTTFRLLHRAALLWVSNQTDDLLCLPHCRILVARNAL
jgi:hypothetical protein